MKKRKLPVGIDNFAKLRKEKFYYVDKTALIVELMDSWSEVNLFTRPRRFGKTLNMSMLKNFFEIGSDKTIFEGLAVARDQELCDTYMGKYPVIFLSLKEVDGLTYEAAYDMLYESLRQEILRQASLLDSEILTEDAVRPLKKILAGEKEPALIKPSLRILSSLLEKQYGQKVILLIDEYDVPLDKAYQHGYYPQMIDLIRGMFGAALKTNDSLFFAVLTGCLRISKESIFTGLNNMKVHSISDAKYDEYFGFTDAEVAQMLSEYGLESHYKETKDWYDGYRFGGQDVYCPWDVINYCDDLCSFEQARPKAYWMNTSGNDMVRRLIARGRAGTTQLEIENLIAGGTIHKKLNENLTHSEIDKNIENLWSLLYMTGYLTSTDTPVGNSYSLRIPNREVQQIYKQQVVEWLQETAEAETDKLTSLYKAFETGDTAAITEFLDARLLDTVSFYDAYESFYHGFLLALLGTCADWRVSSNAETGKGRCDIMVERKDRRMGFVVEIKEVKEEKKLDSACQAARKQIEERDYTAILRRSRMKEIRTYAIAFWEKECRVIGSLA